jgi:hypothetical protein
VTNLERSPIDTVQECHPETDRFCEIAETSFAFVISLVELARESDGNAALVSDPMISEFIRYGSLPRPSAHDLNHDGIVSWNR